MKKHKAHYSSPIGIIELTANEHYLISLKFIDIAEVSSTKHPILLTALTQLSEYFNHERKKFDLPLLIEGTEFQKKVWELVASVPYGNISTYLNIAQRLGQKGSVRAVGAANGCNPFLIVIPCHRIVAVNNKLTGYAGGLWRKKWLLEHESGVLNFK